MKNIQAILENIQTVIDICTTFSDDTSTTELHELRQKLEKNKFYLVVAGLFKRGKSSVINTLIGKNIAPVAITPITAAITIFEYGKPTRCEVIFNDRNCKEIPVDNISEYVTEEENPRNTKNVSKIKVFSNGCEILKKCCIVDTPGLGSIFEHNSKTTQHYIPKIDAALFVLSADTPISKTDTDFLKEIHAAVPQILYVLNKTDLLTESQLEELIRFNTGVIAEITRKDAREIDFINVSSKLAAEDPEKGNFNQLSAAIYKMIDEKKQEILLETGQKQLKQIATDISRFLTVKADALQLPVKLIEEKQHRLKRSIEIMNETRHEFDILIKGQLDKIMEKHLVEIDVSFCEMQKQSGSDVVSALDTLEVIDNNTIPALSEKLSGQIVSYLEKLKERTEQAIIEEFNQVLTTYQNRSQTFLNEFSKMLHELFDMSFEILSGRFNLDIYTSFYFLKFVDGQSVEPKLSAIYRIFPGKLRRMKYQSIVRKNMEILIEVNKGRMKPDIIYRVTESFRRFKTEEEKQVGLVYRRIDKLLEEAIENKMKNKNEIEKELKDIYHKIETLNKRGCLKKLI